MLIHFRCSGLLSFSRARHQPRLRCTRLNRRLTRTAQDISARSPISAYDVPARMSLDSARFARMPRSAINRNIEQLPTAEENFEDVGLEDQKQPPRKRGFFSKLTETQEKDSTAQTGVSRFLMPGRKRAQSGQGAELAAMDQPTVTSSN